MIRLDSWRLRHRFAALAAVALLACALPSALQVAAQWKAMRAARLEAGSAAPLQALVALLRLTQQHRGLAALLLGGKTDVAEQRAARQHETDAAWQHAQATLREAPLAAATRQQLQAAAQEWAALREAVAAGRIDVAASFKRHSALAGQLLAALESISDDHGLSLDTDMGRYQLIRAVLYEMPSLTEQLGRARAQGGGMLATGNTAPAERQALEVAVALAEVRAGQMQAAFDRAGREDAELHRAVGPAMDAALQASREVLQLARREVLETAAPRFAAPDYTQRFTTAIDAQFKVAEVALDRLAHRLDAYAGSERNAMLLLLGWLAALLALGAAASIAVSGSILRQVGGEPGEVIRSTEAIAGGDLARPIAVPAGGDGSIVGSMARMRQALEAVVQAVRDNAESVAAGSTQIAQGNQDLSTRTELQAATLQRTAAAVEELDGTVQRNAGNARQASELARTASAVATRGGAVVGQVVQTMKRIEESSTRIAEIIATVDGIAFQTNILALNAAVEAARAGEQGRGFAVVAGEVRALAQRAAAAAHEIKDLIATSVERVGRGTALVDEAGATMQEVVAAIGRATTLMAEISAASGEQAEGVAQLGRSVVDIDQSTQQNAALVEESAAAAASLQQQAQRLREAVAVFTVTRGQVAAGA
ncbi:MAG: methyl-accepting chemotaxis protein [Rubrivivax sp.]